MPSTTKKQAKTMAAIAHGWKPPKSSGIDIPVTVAKEFNQADKFRHRSGQFHHDPAKHGWTKP